MPVYNYSRSQIGSSDCLNIWNVNCPLRVTLLAEEIELALPGKIFTLQCDDNNVDITFAVSLTTEEETTLTNTVSAHENNT